MVLEYNERQEYQVRKVEREGYGWREGEFEAGGDELFPQSPRGCVSLADPARS